MRRAWRAWQIRSTLRCAGVCGEDVERHRARQHSSMWMHFSGAAGRGSRSDSKLSLRRRRGEAAEQGEEADEAWLAALRFGLSNLTIPTSNSVWTELLMRARG
jgi:hypothetical protein